MSGSATPVIAQIVETMRVKIIRRPQKVGRIDTNPRRPPSINTSGFRFWIGRGKLARCQTLERQPNL
jgi:hypothetical protein